MHRGGWTLDSIRRVFFDLCYTAHGGSGLNFTLADVHAMPMIDILEYMRILDDKRTEEARAIRAASNKR